ncbi:MAG: cytochrome C oxidase subunit IV family protein [Methylophilales bacterium]|nr:cytochrome C oxidase subunit IV family protein [Methylophilales bacterium]
MQPSQSTLFSTVIWVLLVALTIATFSIGEAGMAGKNIMLILLSIAMIKSQMVANYFMALRQTKLIWRLVMLLYFVIVGGLIALAYLIGIG